MILRRNEDFIIMGVFEKLIKNPYNKIEYLPLISPSNSPSPSSTSFHPSPFSKELSKLGSIVERRKSKERRLFTILLISHILLKILTEIETSKSSFPRFSLPSFLYLSRVQVSRSIARWKRTCHGNSKYWFNRRKEKNIEALCLDKSNFHEHT